MGYCPGNHKKLRMIEHTYNLKYIDIYTLTFIHFQNCAWGTHLLSASEGIFATLLLQVFLFAKSLTVGHSCIFDEQKRKICLWQPESLKVFPVV